MRRVTTVLMLVIPFLISSTTSAMDLPSQISYQGRLTDSGGNALTGDANLTMRIYRTPSGGTAIWSESHSGVSVEDGLFSLQLGSVNPIPQSVWTEQPDSVWLGIQVGSDPEISPRTQLTPSPFAHLAGAMPGFVPGPNNISLGTFNFVAGDSNLVDGHYNVVGGGKNNEAYGENEVSPDSAIDIETRQDGFGLKTNLLELKGSRQTGFGATIGGGIGNTAYGFLATVAGGGFNHADGTCSAIGGGCGNHTWHYATVGGGVRNDANALGATIGGGVFNEAEAAMSTIAGGGWSIWGNTASNNEVYDNYGSIGGGGNNKVGSNNANPTDDVYSTIAGGESNLAPSPYSSIGGGIRNLAGGSHNTIGGGEGNITSDNHATVGGGYRNEAVDPWTTVSGGDSSRATAFYATVSGGQANHGANEFTAIGGGHHNSAQGHASAIGGGIQNLTTNWGTAIAGGEVNEVHGYHSAVTGGVLNRVFGDSSYIGGGAANSIQGSLAVVSGGGGNVATGRASVVGGGTTNSATGDTSSIGGGWLNQTNGPSSTIGGGRDNAIAPSGNSSTIGGGLGNVSNGYAGAIGGGFANFTGPGVNATVPGGFQNIAQGDYSFAAGFQARARDDCAFVWNDCCGLGTATQFFASIVPNSFNARATGGFFFATSCDTLNFAGIGTGAYLAPGSSMWSVICDRRAKHNIREISPEDILERVSNLNITRWSYKAQGDRVDHIGPMAQDFYEQFSLGEDNTRISSLDPSGVALAAIQALDKKTRQLEQSQDRIEDLEREISELRRMVEVILEEKASQDN